jgi:hypothetical protein
LYDSRWGAIRIIAWCATYSGDKGSHRVFKRLGETIQLNFQNRQGYILPYQAKQLIAMIAKYGDTE